MRRAAIAHIATSNARPWPGCPSEACLLHTMCMKRTNLVLDEQLLIEATRLSGEKTYSATVQRALRELVDRARARQILDLRGSGLWEGELSEMRDDRPRSRRKR
jgi:Arc/MetJ family transcription regulator